DGHAIRTLHLVKAGDRVADDPLSCLVDPYSVLLTDTFATRLGVGAGAHLPLRTPAGIRTFAVRGILPPGGVGRAYGGNLLLMDVVGAQVVLGRDRLVDQVDVTLLPGVAVEDAARAMNSALASWPGLEAVPPARHAEQIERYLRAYRTLLSGISGLALLAAVFVAGSAVATSVAARRRPARRSSAPLPPLARVRQPRRRARDHRRGLIGRGVARLAVERQPRRRRGRLRAGHPVHATSGFHREGSPHATPPLARFRRTARRRPAPSYPGPARARRWCPGAGPRADAHVRHPRAQLRAVRARLHPPPGARRPRRRLGRDHGVDRDAGGRVAGDAAARSARRGARG